MSGITCCPEFPGLTLKHRYMYLFVFYLYVLADPLFAKGAGPTDFGAYTCPSLPLIRMTHPIIPESKINIDQSEM